MALADRASTYVDEYGYAHDSRATVTVHEEPKSAKVTYHGPCGKFSVIVHQKPNPIGFHARLPGDRRK